MQHKLSTIERSILRAVCAAGGEYRSLFRLAVEIDARYESVWTCTLRLACKGLIEAQRSTGRGRGYTLTLPCGAKGFCPCKVSTTSTTSRAARVN